MADDDALDAVERWFRSLIANLVLDAAIYLATSYALMPIPRWAYVLTDATYRRELLDHVLAELRQAFAVGAVYLAARAQPDG